jgi:transcription-repair coupling factor (superfamily II helicase)
MNKTKLFVTPTIRYLIGFTVSKKKQVFKIQSPYAQRASYLTSGRLCNPCDYGIGRFAGLDKVTVGESEQEAIRLILETMTY